jgi:hypothetical protein
MFCANESVSRGRTCAAEKPNERSYLNLVQVRNSLRRDRVTMVQACPAQKLVNALQGSENVAFSCGLLPGQEALRILFQIADPTGRIPPSCSM